jgi:hypothetical protein
MGFIKHVGKHGDRKIAVVYRTVPDEEHMALVIYPDTLSAVFHDSVMKVIEGDIGQNSEQLAEAMHRSLLSDGRPMLQTLHQEGKLKKVQTNQIIITPNATSHVRLDELNKIFDGMAAGDESAKAMADLDSNAGFGDPVEKAQDAAAVAALDNEPRMESAVANEALSDEKIAADMFSQSEQMANEAKALVTESKRLEKEAFKMNPALKPKRTVKKRTAKKKAVIK